MASSGRDEFDSKLSVREEDIEQCVAILSECKVKRCAATSLFRKLIVRLSPSCSPDRWKKYGGFVNFLQKEPDVFCVRKSESEEEDTDDWIVGLVDHSAEWWEMRKMAERMTSFKRIRAVLYSVRKYSSLCPSLVDSLSDKLEKETVNWLNNELRMLSNDYNMENDTKFIDELWALLPSASATSGMKTVSNVEKSPQMKVSRQLYGEFIFPETLMTPENLGSGGHVDRWDRVCWDTAGRISVRKEQLKYVDVMRREIGRAVQRTAGVVQSDVRIFVFGSVAIGLASTESDVDISVELIHGERFDVKRLLRGIADELSGTPFLLKRFLFSARIPVLTLYHNGWGKDCDVCINNYMAVRKMMLLREYMNMDHRVRPLSLLVKQWATRRGVAEPASSNLGSYSWCLLTIFFLQQPHIGILPVLQDKNLLRSLPQCDVSGYDCRFVSDFYSEETKKLHNFKPNMKWTLGELLRGFYHYYVRDFDPEEHIVNVRSGSSDPEECGVSSRRWSVNSFTIEDPFERGRNLGLGVSAEKGRRIWEQLERASELVESEREDAFHELFVPYFRRYGNRERGKVAIRGSDSSASTPPLSNESSNQKKTPTNDDSEDTVQLSRTLSESSLHEEVTEDEIVEEKTSKSEEKKKPKTVEGKDERQREIASLVEDALFNEGQFPRLLDSFET